MIEEIQWIEDIQSPYIEIKLSAPSFAITLLIRLDIRLTNASRDSL